MFTHDIILNIVAGIVYDVGKKIFNSSYVKKRGILNKIDKYLKANCSNEFDDFIEIGVIESFFKLPQILDIINGYLTYVSGGSLSESLKLKIEKGNNPFVSEQKIIDYLYTELIQYKKGSVVTYPEIKTKCFFSHVFLLVNEYFIKELSIMSRAQLYSSNIRIMQGFNYIYNKMESSFDLISNAMKFPIVDKNENFESSKKTYMDIMGKRHNKALIY